ncbi:hypothetical protein DDB_G0277149 [Dictyostelium discoideum AX4]|uniref:ER membrane protein complex subunit 2 n=1 Tax=Dictyostelium discoideum TaxID=44689 RepID=EMC2_DICDI|nr:hypothetical protein DDB_G0277149 [Dictyostelium discoideum AX4]Q86K48.1 RecName: Full=ER membrane protein complex subunit 2; AltName: Full=Tetratricopeptide repeat protein 35; Short=TPR repeat protein 35 [Dictyostelium discoideum]EAL68760.1 hypothetical protein DDB_G0277149 [Dictyostelium discoideum AX4]|eukprot:XP_642745.1 hypothetical protein DDB_G0277149 [Dictyostelium discoideum AX4]
MSEMLMLTSSDSIEINRYEEGIRNSGRSFNWVLVRDTLRFLRKSKIRKSNLVSKYGLKLVTQYFNKLEDQEGYDTIEQVIVACLDCGDHTNPKKLFEQLKSKFGKDSVRVQRIHALCLESNNQLAEALQIFESILKKYPSDALSMKRQVAIFKGQGNLSKAIQVLNAYLQIYMCDLEAWLELSSFHISYLSYSTALYCLEEVLLNAPINFVFYIKYAEPLYCLGGNENYNSAVQYYTHALELNSPTEMDKLDHPPTFLPAIYGIIMSIYSLCEEGYQLKESQLKLMEWAQNNLLTITKKYSSNDKINLVKHFIDSTDIFNKE